jgi:hypothetical protein
MPRFNFPHDLVPPELPDVCELAIFPVGVVPYALAALESRATAYTWSDDGYLRGNQLIRSLQMAILCGGVKEITNRQDELYRLVATAFYGTSYSVLATDPELIVAPAIMPTHDVAIDNEDSIFGRLEDSRQLLQNALNGTDTPLYDRANGVRDLLELIQAAIEAESNLDPEMLAKLAEIALALA